MALKQFPAREPNTCRLRQLRSRSERRSKYSLQSNIVDFGGESLVMTATWKNIKQAVRNDIRGFLAGIDVDDRVSAPDWSYRVNKAIPNGKVRGAKQTGSSILTDGWPNNTTILERGELLTINNLLYITTEQVRSVNGIIAINLFPKIAVAPDDNSSVNVSSPIGAWIISSNVDIDSIPMFSSFSLTFFQDMAYDG